MPGAYDQPESDLLKMLNVTPGRTKCFNIGPTIRLSMTSTPFQKIYATGLTMGFLFLSIATWAQFPTLSPRATVTQEIGATTMSITYERPALRGRTIFGELVPYGKLWRTGAGNCTKIKFSSPVEIGKTAVPGGTYSLFTIPDAKSWCRTLRGCICHAATRR